jgi:hypothetical protein
LVNKNVTVGFEVGTMIGTKVGLDVRFIVEE